MSGCYTSVPASRCCWFVSVLTWCAMAEEKQKSPQLKPEIVRALTELFLVVENLAQEWGVEQELMVGTLTQEALHTWLEKVG